MSLVTWVLLGVVVLVAIGLGWGVFFSGLVNGAKIVSQNPVVKNATTETGKALANGNSLNGGATVVQTQKTVYKVSEPVTIVLRNNGAVTETFPEHSTTLNIKSQDGSKAYVVSASEDKTTLGPGESLNISWDQHDNQGNQVASGTYVIDVQQNAQTVGETVVTIQQ